MAHDDPTKRRAYQDQFYKSSAQKARRTRNQARYEARRGERHAGRG